VGYLYRKAPPYAPYVMKFICLKWEERGLGDLLEQDVDLMAHLMKELRKRAPRRLGMVRALRTWRKKKRRRRVIPRIQILSQAKKGMFARMEDELKKLFCFQSFVLETY
jgi:hypothetical protein